jgi:hypothetical protein
MIQPSIVTLHLMRPEMWDLLAGGLDRMMFSLTPPYRSEYAARDFLSDDPAAMRACSEWASASGILSCRVLRKLGNGELGSGIWKAMKESAFPGIDQDLWGEDLHHDPKGAVAHDVWTGTFDVRMSTQDFEGAACWPVTITGPYFERVNRWRNNEMLPEGLPTRVAWLMPPKLQTVVADWPIDGLDDGDGMQRPFWDHPYMNSTALQTDLVELASHLPSPISERLLEAASEPCAIACYPELEWSRTVDIWIAPAA